MDLGLALADISNLRDIMQSYIEDDSQIYTIEVFVQDGTVIHSTDSGFVGDLVSEDWVTAWSEATEGSTWTLFQRDSGVVGMTIKDNFDRDVGSIALRYSRDLLDDSVRRIGSHLLVFGGSAVVVIAIVALFGVAVALRGPLSELRRMNLAIRDIDSRAKSGGLTSHSESYPAEIAGFAETVVAAHEALSESTERIREIDEEQAG